MTDWQPIETAPKDGTRVIIYAAEHKEQFIAAWMTSLEEGDGQWVISRSLGANPVAFICREPTDWQPLPDPPGTAKPIPAPDAPWMAGGEEE